METDRIRAAVRLAGSVLALLCASESFAAEGRRSDRDLERFLLKADVTQIRMVMRATTYPMSVDLERKGEVRRALFKYGHHEGPPLDSYLHEVAAYRLDRALELGMVPVAVLREVKAPGALIEWIAPAKSVEVLRAESDPRADFPALAEQQAIMNIFDALVANPDRRESDQLVTTDGRLRLIDHSKAFAATPELPEAFVVQPCRLPRELERRLTDLRAEPLGILLEDLLDDDQLQALLARRDRILAKIESDRERLGEAAVYRE